MSHLIDDHTLARTVSFPTGREPFSRVRGCAPRSSCRSAPSSRRVSSGKRRSFLTNGVKMASRSRAGTRSTIGRGSGPPEDRPVSFDAPDTVVDPGPALAQLDASYAATRESRDVVALLAAHEMSLARGRAVRPPPVPRGRGGGLTLEVSDSDIEAARPAGDFEDAAPTVVPGSTPPFGLPAVLPSRTVELPPLDAVPAKPLVARLAPPPLVARFDWLPSLVARLGRLPLLVLVPLACVWLVLASALGVLVSRTLSRAIRPSTASHAPAPAAPVAAIASPPAATLVGPPVVQPPAPVAEPPRAPDIKKKPATPPRKRAAGARSHRPNPF